MTTLSSKFTSAGYCAGIESWWGRDLSYPSRPTVGPTQLPLQWVPILSPRVKRPGRGADHLPIPSAEVKERVQAQRGSRGISAPPLGLFVLF